MVIKVLMYAMNGNDLIKKKCDVIKINEHMAYYISLYGDTAYCNFCLLMPNGTGVKYDTVMSTDNKHEQQRVHEHMSSITLEGILNRVRKIVNQNIPYNFRNLDIEMVKMVDPKLSQRMLKLKQAHTIKQAYTERKNKEDLALAIEQARQAFMNGDTIDNIQLKLLIQDTKVKVPPKVIAWISNKLQSITYCKASHSYTYSHLGRSSTILKYVNKVRDALMI